MSEHIEEQVASKFRRLAELREARDETKSAAEKTEKDYREYEAELWDDMDDSPVKGARRIDLGEPHGTIVFTPTETKFGRIIDLDAAYEYFEQRAMSEEMFRPKIAKRKLNEIVKEILEAGKPMPPGIDWTARRGIRITKKG